MIPEKVMQDWVKNKKRIQDRLNRIKKRIKKFQKQEKHFEMRLRAIQKHEKESRENSTQNPDGLSGEGVQ
jgi:chaperonin cofactor prefoldin